jgi:hypothetical protein
LCLCSGGAKHQCRARNDAQQDASKHPAGGLYIILGCVPCHFGGFILLNRNRTMTYAPRALVDPVHKIKGGLHLLGELSAWPTYV